MSGVDKTLAFERVQFFNREIEATRKPDKARDAVVCCNAARATAPSCDGGLDSHVGGRRDLPPHPDHAGAPPTPQTRARQLRVLGFVFSLKRRRNSGVDSQLEDQGRRAETMNFGTRNQLKMNENQ